MHDARREPRDLGVDFVESNLQGMPLTLILPDSLARLVAHQVDEPIVLGLRPENIHDAAGMTSPDHARVAEMTVDVAEPMGAETLL